MNKRQAKKKFKKSPEYDNYLLQKMYIKSITDPKEIEKTKALRQITIENTALSESLKEL